MNEMIYLLAGFIVGIIITWIIRKLAFENNHVSKASLDHLREEMGRSQQELAGLRERSSQLQSELTRMYDDANAVRIQLAEKDRLLSATEEANKHLREKIGEQEQNLQMIGKKFETEFQVLAQKILDDKIRTFNQNQESQLVQLLSPLRDQIKTFKSEIETRSNKESEERNSLKGQIELLQQLNKKLSDQADNLTKALTNNTKTQGDWGEMILESILQYAGLQKDLQYFVQQSSYNEEGSRIRPDVVIKYPDGRSLVIDSKVSLVHYTNLVNAGNEDEKLRQRNLLLQSLRQHMEILSRKDYQSVADSLDFIMMFIPVEAAYIEAMQADPSFWQQAYQKRVLLISPTNLIPAMKLVSDMWQRDKINRNANDIAERAGKLYDKLVGFVENFEKVGQQIDKAHETWSESRKQLVSGKGNLISQAQKMHDLQIKSNKRLNDSIIDEAAEDDMLLQG